MISRREWIGLAAAGCLMGRSDPAMEPPKIQIPPGPEYADAERKFQGIPGVERAANGRLWVTWYTGDTREGPQNYVLLATSGDDGKTWSAPGLVIDPPGFVRAFDECLWHDPQGRMWLFWTQTAGHWDGRGGVWAIVTQDSGSAEPHWSAPRRIADGVLMNKPIVLKNGAWLLPITIGLRAPNVEFINKRDHLGLSAEEISGLIHDLGPAKGVNVFATTDRGATFTLLGHPDFPAEKGPCEHMLVERRDGGLWMLVRTRDGIGSSLSTDKGRSWSAPQPSGIQHPSTRFFVRRLRSGKLLLVKNCPPNGKDRSHLTAFLSKDDGREWSGGLLLDERMNVSYPDGVQAPDGRIYVVYDHERFTDREILMAVFSEDDIEAGKCVSAAGRLRILVNRAG